MTSQANVSIVANNTTYQIGRVVQAHAGKMCKGTILVQGTFNGATLSLNASKDSGVTWVPLKDQGGAAISWTANGMINYELGASKDNPMLLAILTTGAVPTCTAYHDDER